MAMTSSIGMREIKTWITSVSLHRISGVIFAVAILLKLMQSRWSGWLRRHDFWDLPGGSHGLRERNQLRDCTDVNYFTSTDGRINWANLPPSQDQILYRSMRVPGKIQKDSICAVYIHPTAWKVGHLLRLTSHKAPTKPITSAYPRWVWHVTAEVF